MKNLRKVIGILILTTLIVSGLFAQGEKEPEVTKLRLSHQMAASHSIHKSSQYFAQRVSELSNGTMEIDVFEAATLGTEAQNLEALREGSLDMAIIAVEFYTNTVPEVGALVMPYIYRDYAHEQAVLQGEAGKLAAQSILEGCDIKILDYYVMAFRQIFTRNKPIKNQKDLAELKIRVPESSLYVNTFKMLGAAPTPIAWGEVYTALDTGVVDGLENVPESVLSASLDEVTTYINLTNHISGPTTFSISNKVFEKMTSEQQDILLKAAHDASNYALQLTIENDAIARKKIVQALEVVNTDVESMKAAIDYDIFDSMKNDKTRQILDLVLAE
jgi:tripartite ATP-independent transporter DctP family solute receptor